MDNISFTSKINFVNAKTFDNKYTKCFWLDFRNKHDFFSDTHKRVMSTEFGAHYFNKKNIDEFFTDGVRTCTAGGIVNTQTGEAVGFHIYDNIDNCECIQDIIKFLFSRIKDPDRALVLGGKSLKTSIYSIPIFKAMCEKCLEKIKNVSVFGEHTFPNSESDLHYSLKDDTWTIHSLYRPMVDSTDHDVQSLEEIARCYEEVTLANGDCLYINNNKIKI